MPAPSTGSQRLQGQKTLDNVRLHPQDVIRAPIWEHGGRDLWTEALGHFCMDITPVTSVLDPEGFGAPRIDALIPNSANYNALLTQPVGEIEASPAGVRNRDRKLATEQYSQFLALADESRADLVVTPEYSMPWDVLVSAIKDGLRPSHGKLWALGCESITCVQLHQIKTSLAPYATVIYEALPDAGERFVGPLAYVFSAPEKDNGNDRLIVLVQFKTNPMGDPDHFETNNLQTGTRVYQFGENGSIRLVSLICSDAFAFEDAQANSVYDRGLILHIQLNPKPRHTQFRQYRERLLRFEGDATEIICLNWARGVVEWSGERPKPWDNIAASAWYLKPAKFDDRDDTLCANHWRGLYYTWFSTLRVHALFFNFKPAAYLVTATKVAHVGVPAALSRRRGPQLSKAYVWNGGTAAWVEQPAADDGFDAIVANAGAAKDEIERLSSKNPFVAERLLALSVGEIGGSEDWHRVRNLDSCAIDSSEVIRRLTFCQDDDEGAHQFRVARLKQCGHLWKILTTGNQLPPALSEFNEGCRLDWSPEHPHQNVVSAKGQRATAIYFGENASETRIEATQKRVASYLHRTTSDPDESHSARQRIVIWFRNEDGEITVFDPHRYVKIDQVASHSDLDIGREQ